MTLWTSPCSFSYVNPNLQLRLGIVADGSSVRYSEPVQRLGGGISVLVLEDSTQTILHYDGFLEGFKSVHCERPLQGIFTSRTGDRGKPCRSPTPTQKASPLS